MCLTVLTACALLALPSHAQQATEVLQSTQIDTGTPSALGKLWSDEIKAAVQRQAAIHKTVPQVPELRTVTAFNASFKMNGRNYVISTLDLRGSADCSASKDFPVGVENNAVNCVTRIAELQPDGDLKPVYSGVLCTARAFDKRSGAAIFTKKIFTTISYDAKNNKVSVQGVDNDENICSNPVINLN